MRKKILLTLMCDGGISNIVYDWGNDIDAEQEVERRKYVLASSMA